MNGRPVLDQFDRVVAPALGALAALVLFAMMMLTCVDVIGRYFFSRPIFGGFELTEMMLAAMIFLGLPLVTLRNEHVTVDVLDSDHAGLAVPHPAHRGLRDRIGVHRLPRLAALDPG